jgi:hypothetical protein
VQVEGGTAQPAIEAQSGEGASAEQGGDAQVELK